jgi:hypothetical protein
MGIYTLALGLIDDVGRTKFKDERKNLYSSSGLD